MGAKKTLIIKKRMARNHKIGLFPTGFDTKPITLSVAMPKKDIGEEQNLKFIDFISHKYSITYTYNLLFHYSINHCN